MIIAWKIIEKIIIAIVVIYVAASAVAFITGCSSAPKAYYCPNGHYIPLEKINGNVGAINTCPVCRIQFPYLGQSYKKDCRFADDQSYYGYYGPNGYYGPSCYFQLVPYVPYYWWINQGSYYHHHHR